MQGYVIFAYLEAEQENELLVAMGSRFTLLKGFMQERRKGLGGALHAGPTNNVNRILDVSNAQKHFDGLRIALILPGRKRLCSNAIVHCAQV